MKVKATERGFFGGQLREPGDEFEIETDGQFSEVWMEKTVRRGRKSKAEVEAESAVEKPAEAEEAT